jgi:TetR/AcrR family transcriptional regulator, regulator of autoinduction and epiphytic fitness
MVTDGPSPVTRSGPTVEFMRTDGADRDPPATPAAGSSTDGSTRTSAKRVPPPTIRRRPLDGRLARGRKTRRLLVEALVDLVDEGSTAPTIPQIAERAGVSVRLIFHHFGGKDGLVIASMVLQSERHRAILFAIPAKGPAALRIRALCRQRRLYFEEITPIYRMAQALGTASDDLRKLLADDRYLLRHQLAVTLAPEVRARGTQSEELVDALERATGWDAWRALRDSQGTSVAVAERAMAFTAVHLIN